MKTRLFISALIALLSLAIYPFMEQLANAERGYANRIDNVFGGEEMLLIFGLLVSLMIVVEGIDKYLFSKFETENKFETEKKRNDNPNVIVSPTESEQSESNSL